MSFLNGQRTIISGKGKSSEQRPLRLIGDITNVNVFDLLISRKGRIKRGWGWKNCLRAAIM